MSERVLGDVLRRIADEASPVPMGGDLWTRGRRRRRVRIVAGLAVATLVAVFLPLVLRSTVRPAATPAEPPPSVPAQVYTPFPFQRTVNAAPPGPASVVIGPDSGNDTFTGFEDSYLVVGRNGSYRLVRVLNSEVRVLLSPDGTSIAGDGDLEGSDHDRLPSTSVLDLSTGRVRQFDGGTPVAWAPNGGQLIILRGNPARLAVLDLSSGRSRDLFGLGGDTDWLGFVAFSSDGRAFAVQLRETIQVVDVATGDRRILAHIDATRRLAGPGAWTPDGKVALVEVVGCSTDCTYPETAARTLRVAYLDATTGAEVAGPALDEMPGVDVRVLGWQADGDAVVTVFRPIEADHPGQALNLPPGGSWPYQVPAGGVGLFALHPGGGHTELVRLPRETAGVDVARDLLAADRFGGPVPSVPARLADWLVPWTGRLLLIAAVIVAFVAYRRLKRRLRLESLKDVAQHVLRTLAWPCDH